MKDLATPVVRPVSKEGTSTYHEVIITPRGTAKFGCSAAFFRGKKVVITPRASSGEIFFCSIQNSMNFNAAVMLAPSLGPALEKGTVDLPTVKNVR